MVSVVRATSQSWFSCGNELYNTNSANTSLEKVISNCMHTSYNSTPPFISPRASICAATIWGWRLFEEICMHRWYWILSNITGRLLIYYIFLFFAYNSNWDKILLVDIQMDNCCLHHKETLRKPEVASLVIHGFVDKGTSVDQQNKVCICQCCNFIYRTYPSFLSLTVAQEMYLIMM